MKEEVDGRKALSDHGVWTQNRIRREPCAHIVCKGRRYTVALTAVAKGQAMKEVLRTLLKQARSAGIAARLLLLDRRFYSVDVIRYYSGKEDPHVARASSP